MGLFGFKFNINKDSDFIFAVQRISNLELEIEKLKTHINSLRGLINRKVFKELTPDEKEQFKSPDGLDELRKNG